MSLLKNLHPTATRVDLCGGHAEVWGLSIRAILGLIDRHPALVDAFKAPAGPERSGAIVAAIRASGPDAIADVIDAATKSESGTAASADLTAVDELELLVAAVRSTLPEQRLGKLMAAGEGWLDALGLQKAA